MATYTTTTKYALRALTGSSLVSEIDIGFASLAADIDAAMAGYVEGTLGSRPAAGKSGRLYRTTDTGQMFIDTGTAWVEMQFTPSKGFAQIATSESTSSATPVDLTTVGPSVTLTVPANARVAVGGYVDCGNPTLHPFVYLAENGVSIGQVIEGNSSPSRFYITPTSWQSLSGPLIGTNVRVQAGELVFPPSGGAGTYTYKFLYASDGGTANFSNRTRASLASAPCRPRGGAGCGRSARARRGTSPACRIGRRAPDRARPASRPPRLGWSAGRCRSANRAWVDCSLRRHSRGRARAGRSEQARLARASCPLPLAPTTGQ
jgi:hypothetical protein